MNTTDKQPIWAEIRNDYHEEDENGFIVAHLDAWKTNDPNDENGEVIAKVVGARIDGQAKIYVSYQNVDAQIDETAQSAIKEAARDIRNTLDEQLGELRRVRLEAGESVVYQVVHYETGKPDGTVVARISKTSGFPADVQYNDDLVLDLKDRVNESIREILLKLAAE